MRSKFKCNDSDGHVICHVCKSPTPCKKVLLWLHSIQSVKSNKSVVGGSNNRITRRIRMVTIVDVDRTKTLTKTLPVIMNRTESN